MSDFNHYAWAVTLRSTTNYETLLLSDINARSEEEAEGLVRKYIKNKYPDHTYGSNILIRYLPKQLDKEETTTHEYEGTHIKPEFSLPKHF